MSSIIRRIVVNHHLRWLQALHRLHVELVQCLHCERCRSIDILVIFVVFFISVLTEALGPNAEVAAPLIVNVQVIAQVYVVCLVFLLKNFASSGAVARSVIKTCQII